MKQTDKYKEKVMKIRVSWVGQPANDDDDNYDNDDDDGCDDFDDEFTSARSAKGTDGVQLPARQLKWVVITKFCTHTNMNIISLHSDCATVSYAQNQQNGKTKA